MGSSSKAVSISVTYWQQRKQLVENHPIRYYTVKTPHADGPNTGIKARAPVYLCPRKTPEHESTLNCR